MEADKFHWVEQFTAEDELLEAFDYVEDIVLGDDGYEKNGTAWLPIKYFDKSLADKMAYGRLGDDIRTIVIEKDSKVTFFVHRIKLDEDEAKVLPSERMWLITFNAPFAINQIDLFEDLVLGPKVWNKQTITTPTLDDVCGLKAAIGQEEADYH